MSNAKLPTDFSIAAGNGAAGTQVTVVANKINHYQAQSDLPAATDVLTMTLSSPGGGEMTVQGLSSPILLSIRLEPAPRPKPCTEEELTAGDCSDCPYEGSDEASSGDEAPSTPTTLSAACGGRGQCVYGQCWCELPYSGDRCELAASCSYFDERPAVDDWSSDGCVLADPPVVDGSLQCECTHLTDFAGIAVPTSAAELLEELKELQIVLPCAGGFTGKFSWDENPLLWTILFSLAAADLLSLPFATVRNFFRRRSSKRKERIGNASLKKDVTAKALHAEKKKGGTRSARVAPSDKYASHGSPPGSPSVGGGRVSFGEKFVERVGVPLPDQMERGDVTVQQPARVSRTSSVEDARTNFDRIKHRRQATFRRAPATQAVFNRFDLDGSGEIDKDELVALCAELGRRLTPKEEEQALSVLDKDGSGMISFAEFDAWWAGGANVNLLSEDDKKAKELFDARDLDKSGEINATELLGLCKDLGLEMSEKDVAEAFKALDTTNDGKVGFPEFLVWWRYSLGELAKKSEEIKRARLLMLQGLLSMAIEKRQYEEVRTSGKAPTLASVAELNKAQTSRNLVAQYRKLRQSQAAELAKQRNWGALGRHTLRESALLAKRKRQTFLAESQDRHTLVGVLAPPAQDDDDPQQLSIPQITQVFWNVILIELLVTAMWSQTSGTSSAVCEQRGNETHHRTDVRDGNATHFYLNETIWHERDNGTDPSSLTEVFDEVYNTTALEMCTGGGATRLLTLLITGLFTALSLVLAGLTCRLIFRIGNKPNREGRKAGCKYYFRFVLSWTLNLGVFAGCEWVVAAYGRCFGKDTMDGVLIGWLVGSGISWGIMEPGFIMLITFFPFLCNTGLMSWCNDRMNDVGCDLSLLL